MHSVLVMPYGMFILPWHWRKTIVLLVQDQPEVRSLACGAFRAMHSFSARSACFGGSSCLS